MGEELLLENDILKTIQGKYGKIKIIKSEPATKEERERLYKTIVSIGLNYFSNESTG